MYDMIRFVRMLYGMVGLVQAIGTILVTVGRRMTDDAELSHLGPTTSKFRL